MGLLISDVRRLHSFFLFQGYFGVNFNCSEPSISSQVCRGWPSFSLALGGIWPWPWVTCPLWWVPFIRMTSRWEHATWVYPKLPHHCPLKQSAPSRKLQRQVCVKIRAWPPRRGCNFHIYLVGFGKSDLCLGNTHSHACASLINVHTPKTLWPHGHGLGCCVWTTHFKAAPWKRIPP